MPLPLPSPDGPLSYGIQLPVQSQSAIYAEPWEAVAVPADLVRIARAADRSGFAYIASCDHIAIPRRLAEGMSTVWYDPVATLAFLAGVTERVRLMSHVAVVGLRHPLVTAKQYATLDHLSGGRLILGVGAGHVREEFEAVGADFDGRGGVLDETIDALRAALGPQEYPEFAGERFSFGGLGQLPRPAQERVPLWVGGSSPAAVRRAAVKGDGWLPQGDPGTGCPRRSPGCTPCGRRRGSRSRSSSVRSPNRCTWVSPGGPWGGGSSPGSPRRSRSRCGRTRRSACTRSRCGSGAGAWTN
ncbi:F420-dependent glucose-6-phosphate dehydrogenase [Streptomyces microflavus]